MFINRILKTKISSSLENEFNKYKYNKTKNSYYQFQASLRMIDVIRLLIPWNKFTYPFLAILIAYKESKNAKWFFKIIIEHIIWSFKKFDSSNLPKETLRKIVNVKDKDETLELRKGR
jgi:hypothetical protein